MVMPVSQRPIPGNIELDFAERTNDFSQDVAVDSIQILPPNRHRTAAWLINNSTVVIYLGLDRPATITSGIRLNAAGGSFEINFTNLFRGAVNAISASGSGNNLLALELESRYAH